jgi:hypothetical protein
MIVDFLFALQAAARPSPGIDRKRLIELQFFAINWQ